MANRYKRYLQEKAAAGETTDKDKGDLTVSEAGRMGGEKGGQRERELVEQGKRVEQEKKQ